MLKTHHFLICSTFLLFMPVRLWLLYLDFGNTVHLFATLVAWDWQWLLQKSANVTNQDLMHCLVDCLHLRKWWYMLITQIKFKNVPRIQLLYYEYYKNLRKYSFDIWKHYLIQQSCSCYQPLSEVLACIHSYLTFISLINLNRLSTNLHIGCNHG